MCEEKEGQAREEGDSTTDGRSEETMIGVCVLLRRRVASHGNLRDMKEKKKMLTW